MNNYDPFKKNITCDKVFTYIEGGTQSFCIEHENGAGRGW